MNIVLLSGGSGKRLWPLSNDIRSKQFIKILKNEKGEYESMVQRVYRQIRQSVPEASIVITASKGQVSAIHNQLGTDVGICVEPCRRDTFPAMVLAASYLRDKKGLSLDEPIVVCPVDPFVDSSYFRAFEALSNCIRAGACRLMLLGIDPVYPSEKYGYILPKSSEQVSRVAAFREKPDEETAKRYISRGALWNGGVFAFRLGYILEKAHECMDFKDYTDLSVKYETLKPVSFDYAVAEKETEAQVMRYSGEWKDLGTWNTLTEAMDEPVIGDVIMNEVCENVHVVNELDVPVLCMGLKNLVVSASPEGILVSDKTQSSYIKPFVEELDRQIMFAEKSWGSFRVIDIEEGSMTIKVTLNPGHRMNYHSHDRRDEVWTVVSGKGRVIVDGRERAVCVGDVIKMPAKSRHTIIAETELKVVEVQIGRKISVYDKRKYEFDSEIV